MKFRSKKSIFGVIWGGIEGDGPCLGVRHIWEKSPKKIRFLFGGAPLSKVANFEFREVLHFCGVFFLPEFLRKITLRGREEEQNGRKVLCPPQIYAKFPFKIFCLGPDGLFKMQI